MRWRFLIVCAVWLWGCGGKEVVFIGSPEPDERVRMGVHGAVREVREKNWDADSDDSIPAKLIEAQPTSEEAWVLDSEGRLTEYKKWDRGRLMEHRIIHLNLHGQLVESETSGYNGNRIRHRSVAYFPNGKVREIQLFNAEGELEKRTWYTYDALERLAMVETEDHSNQQTQGSFTPEKIVYSYEDTTSVLRLQEEFRGEELQGQQFFDNGTAIKSIRFDAGKIATTSQFQYDSKGLLMRIRTTFEGKDGRSEYVYFYDSLGQLIRSNETSSFRDDTGIVTYRYDSLGALIWEEAREVNASGITLPPIRVTDYHYEYDSLNNWTVKETWENKRLQSIRARTFKFAK
jgi:hypothetical protein